MVDSILNTIKQMLGISSDDNAFDVDIITGINTALMTLYQLGVGPTTPYFIENSTQTWANFLTTPSDYMMVKTYIYLKVKLTFDPPASSYVLTSIENQISEMGWRLAQQVPIPPETV